MSGITTNIAKRLRFLTGLFTLGNVADGHYLKRDGSAIVGAAGVGGTVDETELAFTDITTANSSSSKHGLLPKLENSGSKFLKDDGTWAPAGITNSAGANVVPKSDGANLVASQISDDGTSVTIAAAGQHVFSARSKISSPANGNVLLTNNAGTDFTGLQFGGTTSSFPMLKRSANRVFLRLADDSGAANLHLAKLLLSDLTVLASSADGVMRLVNGNDETTFNRLQFGGTTSSFPSIKRSTTRLQARLADDSAAAALQSTRVVSAKTGDYPVVDADADTFFTNTGAGAGVIFTLPTPVVGMTYEFYRDANQIVTVDVGGAVTIQVGASVTSAGGNVTLDAVGSRIRVVAISTTQWVGDVTGAATFN